MPRFLIHHRHRPPECGVVVAAFKGHESPLRHRATLASCAFALGLLPFYVAERATATRVGEVQIP
jgi:hypothetical protein